MLNFSVVPEIGLQSKTFQFLLGMPLSETIEIIRKHDSSIKSLELWFSDKVSYFIFVHDLIKLPFSLNIVLYFQNDGLKLVFHPEFQRLILIEIFDLTKVMLNYWSQTFCSDSKYPSLDDLYRIFGSTKPMTPSKAANEFMLSYRGICFSLINNNTSEVFGVDPDNSEDFIVKKLFIFSGNTLEDAKLPSIPHSSLQGNIYANKVTVVRKSNKTEGLSFDMISLESSTNPNKEPKLREFTSMIHFGDSVQDVLSMIGTPNRIFYKTDDKMKIHLPQNQKASISPRSNYFYNYFTLGVDILFDAVSHSVIKFILHNNLPNDCNFNVYHRCNFFMSLQTKDDLVFDITPFSKWSEVYSALGQRVSSQPVVIHREAKRKRNIFQPTLAYGFNDIIFEILPNSDYLVSVTLYSTNEKEL